jgi:hypothetical protein
MHAYKMNVKMMMNLLLNMCIMSHIFMHHKLGYLYPMKMFRIFISNEYYRILCIQNEDDCDTDVSKVATLRWSVPHAYLCLGALHTFKSTWIYAWVNYVNHLNMCFVIMCLVNLDDLYALLNLVKCVLDDVSLFLVILVHFDDF